MHDICYNKLQARSISDSGAHPQKKKACGGGSRRPLQTSSDLSAGTRVEALDNDSPGDTPQQKMDLRRVEAPGTGKLVEVILFALRHRRV